MSDWKRTTVLATLLFVLATTPFLRSLPYPFTMFDDRAYVTENPVVLEGISAKGTLWAFTAMDIGNWHPLAWISHMASVSLHGLDPKGHRGTNIAIHGANAVIIFLLFASLTGWGGRAFVVAALFAVHPLRVESVVWISERKDVLCAFFILAGLLAHVRYARRPSIGRYLLVAALFAAALMSKAMAVTFPFLLLLLDAWPLRRFAAASHDGVDRPVDRGTFLRIVGEKVPLLLMSAAASLVAVRAQTASLSIGNIPFGDRVANAVTSCAGYLCNTFWPTGLGIFYPLPASIQFLPVAVAAALLLFVSGFAIHRRREEPWLAFGWCWFLGTLVPVLGFVQVGGQAMADRYTYVPSIGIAVCVVFSVADIFRRRSVPGWGSAGVAGVIVAALAVATFQQTVHWRDDTALFARAVSVTGPNAVAEMNLGVALDDAGDPATALFHLRRAVSIRPEYQLAYYNLGNVLAKLGRLAEAEEAYRTSISLLPSALDPYMNLGKILFQQGRFQEAIGMFRTALRINPGHFQSKANLGITLSNSGQAAEAIPILLEALAIRPGDRTAMLELGIAYGRTGRNGEAERTFRQIIAVDPGNADARRGLEILAEGGGR